MKKEDIIKPFEIVCSIGIREYDIPFNTRVITSDILSCDYIYCPECLGEMKAFLNKYRS